MGTDQKLESLKRRVSLREGYTSTDIYGYNNPKYLADAQLIRDQIAEMQGDQLISDDRLAQHLVAYRVGYQAEIAYFQGTHPRPKGDGEVAEPTVTIEHLRSRLAIRGQNQDDENEHTSGASWEGSSQAIRDRLAEMETAEALDEVDFERGRDEGVAMIERYSHALSYVRSVVEIRSAWKNMSPYTNGFTQAYVEGLAEMESEKQAQQEFESGRRAALDVSVVSSYDYVRSVVESRQRSTPGTPTSRGFTQGYVDRLAMLEAEIKAKDAPCPTCGGCRCS